jgi:hypothetical protein
MRTVHWLFVVSVALFVTGIGFVIAAGRSGPQAAAANEAPAVVPVPVASIKQIMAGITGPAATVVYNAVGTVINIEGVTEIAPENDEEWAAVAASAGALVESGNLLLMGSRVLDDGDWVTMAQALIETGTVALRAAEAQSADGIMGSGGDINETCDNCHAKYQRQ